MTHPVLRAHAFVLAILLAGSARADEEDIPFADSPAAVQKTIRVENKGAGVEELSKQTEDGETTYWTELHIDGRVYDIGVAEDGTLKELTLQIFAEEELSFTEAPEAVRKTFTEESRGTKVDDLVRERRLGLTVYVASVGIGGKTYEVKVAEDGTLVEKILQIEEDDVEFADCPVAVQKALQEASKGGNLGDITRSAGIAKRVYLAKLTANGNAYVIEVSEDGTLLGKTLEKD